MFVDDLRENIAGAEAVGMLGLLHRDPDETIEKLEERLGLALGDPADTERPPADTERRVTRR